MQEENGKNKNFVQMYRAYIDDIAALAKKSPIAFQLFLLLIKHMDGQNALCVSMAVLTELLNVSRQSVSKAVRYLKENGWISVLKSGSSNVYIVNPNVCWTSYDNQKQYCKFTANVLLSSSENAEYLNQSKASTHYKTIDKDFVMEIVQAAEKNK